MSGSSSQNNGFQMGGQTSNNSRSGQSQFGQNVFNGNALNGLYSAAQNLFGSQMGNNQNAQNWSQNQANGAATANQDMQQGGVYGGLGIGDQLMKSLQQSQNNPSNMQQINSMIMGGNGNTSLDAMKSSLEANAARANNLTSAEDSAKAAASGMSGGSRQGVMDALNRDNTNRNLQSTEANLGYNSFNDDLNRKLGIASQADANNFGRQQLMSGMLNSQQGTINQGINNTGNIQGYGNNANNTGWNQLDQYRNAIGGPTVLNSGNSSNNSQGASTGWGTGQNSGSGKGSGLL
jgi:hypothetical protein